MIKRLTAMTAALILIFAVGANEKREAWGEPVKEPVAEAEEPETATRQLEPIRPKEVVSERRDDTDSGTFPETEQEGTAGDVDVPATALQAVGTIGGEPEPDPTEDPTPEPIPEPEPVPVPEPDTTTDEGDPVAPQGEPSDTEEYSGGDEDAEPDAVADGGQDEVVTDPEPEPAVEEPQMEYLGDFTISGYCSCSSCCGQWSGGPCADGSYPEEGYTCAMGGLDFGTVLYIDRVGYRTICDRGTDYGWVDLYFTNHDSALAWGLQTRSVYIVR